MKHFSNFLNKSRLRNLLTMMALFGTLVVTAAVFTMSCDSGLSDQLVAEVTATPGDRSTMGVDDEITLTSPTKGATIYYTITVGYADPSPRKTYSESNKPKITETTTITAFAAKSGMRNSNVTTFTYTVRGN